MVKAIGFVLAVLTAGVASAQAASSMTEEMTVPAEKSCGGKAFTYRRTFREQLKNHLIYEVRFPSPVVSPYEANNTVPGELYMPAGAARDGTFPAVVCMHILNGNYELSRLLCTRLSENGVVAMFFKQPYYDERGGAEGRSVMATRADVFIGAMEQGIEDARRAVDILQALPEVDGGKVGLTGISLGALQAAVVCGCEPRIYKAFLILVGSDLKQVILNARETRGVRAAIEGFPPEDQKRVWACIARQEPLAAQEGLRRLAAAGHLRMVCAENDQVLPPEGGRRLAEAAGCADQVMWLKGMDHYTAMAGFPRIMEEGVALFGADAPATWRPAETNGAATPMDLVGQFMSGLAAVLGGRPETNRAHMVGLEATVTVEGKCYEGRLDYACGGQGRFKLTGVFPEVGQAGLGLGSYPWLIGGGKKVFCGTEATVAGRLPVEYILPQHLMRFQIGAGVLAGAALAPEALKPYATVTETNGLQGERVVELGVSRKRTKGMVSLAVSRYDGTPLRVAWSFNESSGEVRFTHWRLNAVADDSVFDAPPGLPRQAVRQDDMFRMFASVFQFAMEATE
jgi:dienelactone hydrolase